MRRCDPVESAGKARKADLQSRRDAALAARVEALVRALPPGPWSGETAVKGLRRRIHQDVLGDYLDLKLRCSTSLGALLRSLSTEE